MKTCTGCGHDKPLEDYYRQAKAPDGHRARCKTCLKSDATERYARLTAEEYAAKLEKERVRRHEERRRVGIKPPRVGRSPLCTYATCKRIGVTEGLCDTHHHEVTKGSESPLALVGGRWEKSVGGVRRWVA